MKYQLILLVLCSLFKLSQVNATENVYAVASVGAGNIDYDDESNTKFGYKLGIGYQFHRQWYMEAGIQKFALDSMASRLPDSAEALNDDELQLDGSALFLSVLGKAAGPVGELYYRLGLLNTDVKGQQSKPGIQECELGMGTQISLEGGQNYTYCQYDEGGIAGAIGLGFDYFLTDKTMLRTEIEYIRGQDNLEISSAFVGLRYNF